MGLILSALSSVSTNISDFFNHLQSYPEFFALELVFSFYLLIALALIADKFLLPSLLNISKRYNLSKDWTGILVALGNLVPELAFTVLSFISHGIKTTEVALACNIGCACCAISIVPAFAILINYDESKESHPNE